MMSVNLSGRRVLVTGASSGLGADVSRSVVAGGGAVAMLALTCLGANCDV
jgi:NAD(P)-dependent dehydrogenase (short-subunit alcohol dehydrogenase family)